MSVDPSWLGELTIAEQAAEASKMDVSASDASTTYLGLGIGSTQLAGKRVLDMASGASNFVLDCRQYGIEAFGIDPVYADKKLVDQRSDEFLKHLADEQMAMTPMYMSDTQKVKVRFMKDFATHPERYIAGSSLDIPLRDDSFDVVTSNMFLTHTAGLFPDFVYGSMREGLRVLRSKGMFYAGPLGNISMTDHNSQEHVVEQNVRKAIKRLEAERLIRKVAVVNTMEYFLAFHISKR